MKPVSNSRRKVDSWEKRPTSGGVLNFDVVPINRKRRAFPKGKRKGNGYSGIVPRIEVKFKGTSERSSCKKRRKPQREGWQASRKMFSL